VLTVIAALALVAALGFAWWTSSQPPPPPPIHAAPATTTIDGPHAAPFDAFATAQVGDWYAVKRINKQPSAGDIEVTVVLRVREVDDKRVVRAMRGRVVSTGEMHDEPDDTFPRAGLTLERLTGLDHASWPLGDVATTDDTRTIAGRAFACKKVTFHPTDPALPRKRVTTELWYSSEVPAGGLVAEHEMQDLDAMHFESTEELVGFGSAGGATWGALPEGLSPSGPGR
jgi:hypothetical protein